MVQPLRLVKPPGLRKNPRDPLARRMPDPLISRIFAKKGFLFSVFVLFYPARRWSAEPQGLPFPIMSEQPNSPNSNPNSRGTGDPGGFNWRLLTLLSVAALILGLAFLNNPLSDKETRELSYSEFQKFWDQGRIVTNDAKRPLTVITTDTSFDAKISGLIAPEQKKSDTSQELITHFSVPVNLDLQGAEINELVGGRIRIESQTAAIAPPGQPAAEVPGTGADAAPPAPTGPASETLTLAEFRKAYALGQVQVADAANPLRVISTPGSAQARIAGTRKVFTNLVVGKDAKGKDLQPEPFAVSVSVAILGDNLGKLIQEGATYERHKDYFGSILMTFLPILLVLLLLFFLFRHQMKSAGRGALSFGKSKARLLSMDKHKVTFKDVAGIQESKEELSEIVEFLRDPRKFQKLGGSIPKGVLMVGAPGTGKTLLARAIAGEADVPFFSISGSDFVEMFVGVGASRVRDMFEQGKKHAPCLIFIDEIDAVGRHRGHGLGGGHDEREQTLNQLLVEMDGFDTTEGVIIIAATNRPDVLDPALLRPGRFDRQVTIPLPDVNGREEILRVHVRKIKLAASTDLSKIARGTPGFSGAELANLVNEAALLAARRNLAAVTLDEMEEARDKVRWGRERRSLAMSDKEKTATAWHEAGHAILLAKLSHSHPLHKVTIIPRGPSLGSTMWLPEGDRYCKQRKEALDDLVVAVGGRIAESFFTSDISNGASGDIRQATALARTMVCEWGMSEKLGMIEYGEGDSPVFLGRGDIGRRPNYSSHTARLIDEEIKQLIDDAFRQATEILTASRDKVELIAKALLEYETLDANHVRDLIEFGEMRDPPSAPKPPPVPEELRKKPAAKTAEENKPNDNGPIPGIVGAPA
jgi:cell division protease FtsH